MSVRFECAHISHIYIQVEPPGAELGLDTFEGPTLVIGDLDNFYVIEAPDFGELRTLAGRIDAAIDAAAAGWRTEAR
jgi:hypothetical protein